MKVLVIGSGGREHAIAWKTAQSKRVSKLYCAPGNGGTAQIAENIEISGEDISKLLKFAKTNKIDLTIVGPEAPLTQGIVDLFEGEGLRVFGPRKEVAQLEGSKVFAKNLMAEFKIPTAKFKIFDKADEAKKYIKEHGSPLVVKADGLCAGKGVIVCKSVNEGLDAIKLIMEERKFGPAGDKVIVEDCLIGEEASIIVLTDGKNALPLASSQDHKAIYDGDKGPNTGGMGAYSPAPVVTDALFKKAMNEVVYPLINGLAKKEKPYKGVIYAGLMVTKEGPKVLEFNARFGDPETQAIFPRLKDDLVDLAEASIGGRLGNRRLNWDQRSCVSVVIASGGYPDSYQKGKTISGLDEVGKMKDVVVFHAGTKCEKDKSGKPVFLTSGGRVLNITALGTGVKEAVDKAYNAVSKIKFENMYYRRDIAHRAVGGKNEKGSYFSCYGK